VKRMIALCMMLMLCTSALASPIVAMYSVGDDYAPYFILLDESGNLLTPRDTYGNIWPIARDQSRNLFAVSRAALETVPENDADYVPNPCALMDADGNLLTGFDYLSLDYFPEDHVVIFADMDGMHGAMDESGSIIVESGYISLCPNGAGGFLAIAGPEDGPIDYEKAYPVEYIDANGRPFDTGVTAMPYGLSGFSEGFCAVTHSYEDRDSGCLFLDSEGTNVFGRGYGYSDGFYGNYAVVSDSSSGLYAFIDKTGAFVTEPIYASIDPGRYYDSGVFLACTGDEALVLDAYTLETRARIDLKSAGADYAYLSGKHFIAAYGNERSFLYDLDGNRIVSGVLSVDHYYGYADAMPGRLIITYGEWPDNASHLIDGSGELVGPEFQTIYAASWKDGQGRYIFGTYEIIEGEDGERWPNWSSYRYGLCDEDGNTLLEAKYASLDYMAPGLYWADLGPRCGLIDETGKWLYAINDYEYLMD